MRILQTIILPDELLSKYKLSYAAANFSRNLISGGAFGKVYSLLPVHVQDDISVEGTEDYELVFFSWRNKGGKFTFLASLKEQYTIFKKIRKGDSLWVYNVNMLNAFLIVLIKLFKQSVSLNAIILDYTPSNQMSVKDKFLLGLINNMDGNIRLADSELFTCNNHKILPGVVPVTAGNEPLIINPQNKFLLSGALDEHIAQTSMVLKAFAELPNCELHITGRCDDLSLIKEYSEKYTNIIFHGLISFEDYMAIMHSVTFLLSTRDESFPENRCNFPSKIIETLLHNRIVVSTMKYEQLDGIKYLKVDSNCEAFKSQVSEICSKPNEDLMEYANQGDLVTKMFSTEVWNETMKDIENNIK